MQCAQAKQRRDTASTVDGEFRRSSKVQRGRQRLEKAEERFTEALVRAGERIGSLGMRAAMRRDEARNESAAAQAGDSQTPKVPSEGGMSYSPTSPADSPRG